MQILKQILSKLILKKEGTKRRKRKVTILENVARKSAWKVHGKKEEARGTRRKERDETKGSVHAFPRCFPSFFPFFLSFIRHAIHVSSLRHPRFNLDEVEGWILEGPGLLCVRASNGKNVSRVVEETSCGGGLNENWREGRVAWWREEKVRRTKNKWEGRTRLKVVEQRTLYERNWWRDARVNEQNVSPHDITGLPPPETLVSGRGSSRGVSCGPEISLS